VARDVKFEIGLPPNHRQCSRSERSMVGDYLHADARDKYHCIGRWVTNAKPPCSILEARDGIPTAPPSSNLLGGLTIPGKRRCLSAEARTCGVAILYAYTLYDIVLLSIPDRDHMCCHLVQRLLFVRVRYGSRCLRRRTFVFRSWYAEHVLFDAALCIGGASLTYKPRACSKDSHTSIR
jgi:hypothetical protein